MSRARTLLALLAIPAFLAAAAIPAVAKKAHKSSAPVIKSISPMRIQIGHTLTIRGSGFIKGKHKNTVVFMGAGKRVVWVKADKSSTRTIKVKLPSKLAVLLGNKNGTLQATRLQIRVIARKSGRAFTKRGKSPIVSPGLAGTGTGTTSCGADPSSSSHDADHDFLSDQLEAALHTNPCSADSDGDGIPDGYEYQSALDLNRNANSSAIPWPYPGARPYPNPLYSADGDVDFDGDSLTLREEYTASFAWALGIDPGHHLGTFLPYAPNPNPQGDVMVVAYSDGDQTTNASSSGNLTGDPSGPAAPSDPNAQSTYDVNGDGVVDANDLWGFVDLNANGVYDAGTDVPSWNNYWGTTYLHDDEKDIDGDGLPNFDETHGALSGPAWWLKDAVSKDDGTYYLPYSGTDWLNPDTDGDGLNDGADDQDHDGYTNIEEDYGLYVGGRFMAYAAAHNAPINVHAFNPCLPNVMSPACSRHPDKSYAPFKDSSRPATFSTWPAP
jgi:IPT/TIG domain-containing protein/thrombospondin type 3 repeat protein